MGLSVAGGAGPLRYSKSIRMPRGGGSGVAGLLVGLVQLTLWAAKWGLVLLWWMALASWWLLVVLPVRAVQHVQAHRAAGGPQHPGGPGR